MDSPNPPIFLPLPPPTRLPAHEPPPRPGSPVLNAPSGATSLTATSPASAARWGRRGPMRVACASMQILTTLALLAGMALFLGIGVGPHIFGYRPVTMLSGSMTPTIRPGDMAIDTPEPLSAVRVGQILTIRTPTPSGYVDSHRVTHVQRLSDGAIVIRTKGDANKVQDPWHAQLHGPTVWRVRAVLPRLGYLVNALRGPLPHVLLLWVAPLVLVAWLLAGIWRPARPARRHQPRPQPAPRRGMGAPAPQEEGA